MIPFLQARVEATIQNGTYKWWVLAVVECCILLVGVDSSIVNLALPTITSDLQATLSVSQWTISAYFVTSAVALPAAGRLVDLFGRKRIFIGGFGLFTLASVLCGAAPNVGWLIAMRILQAFGAAALLANGNAITVTVFPKREHGLALGINGTVFSLGYALGYSLGGLLIHAFGWRSIFLVNLPIGLVAMALGGITLIESRIAMKNDGRKSFDLGGAVLCVLALGCLTMSLEGLAARQEATRLIGILLVTGTISLGLFVARELRVAEPLMQLRLFRIPVFSLGLVTRALYTMLAAACAFLVPFYCQFALGYTALETGFVMLPYALVLGIAGPLAGRLSDKIGARVLTMSGFLFGGLSLLVLGSLQGAAPATGIASLALVVVAGMALLGISSGLFMSPNMSATLDAVPQAHSGEASGLAWSLSFLGSAIGTAFSSTILDRHHAEVQSGSVNLGAFLTAQTAVFHILIGASLVGAALCLFRRRPRQAEPSGVLTAQP